MFNKNLNLYYYFLFYILYFIINVDIIVISETLFKLYKIIQNKYRNKVNKIMKIIII